MKIRVLIQVVLITLAIHSTGYANGNDKTLWGQAEYGMTPAQVLKVFPDAQKNPKPKTSPRNNSHSHVIIPTKNIHGVFFKVSFSFSSTGLTKVTLHSSHSSRRISDLMESLLCERYGTPSQIDDYEMKRQIDWYESPVSIQLSYYRDGVSGHPSLFIIYDHFRYDAVNSQ
tara:strand:- start:1872 stop:2384 length:513 start_codon:yes stop_codon:yes gene_type:complete